MALFSISDLHLSFGTDKPMDIFGKNWENYENRLAENWNGNIGKDDVVIVNGDNSWATYLKDTFLDFKFINELNGKKLLLKGNHDYWWTTMNKQNEWCKSNGFDTIHFLHNNFYMYKDIAVCGTRGWQMSGCGDDDKRVYKRELARLENSLALASRENPARIISAMHYPPDDGFKEILKKYNVTLCLFGHFHAQGFKDYEDYFEDGIFYKLVSCDFLKFNPYKIIA